ncbi:hypothetical protein EYZ11_005471 [Aspergillus tanneri]|uniref:Uncharacterized protein n=1 Tax=Aspergillus tanneri TaxID=1220188 RepID=A0A4S3JI32_9EURO|nr:hypothetical protein EYZ11_005471 [Aspergillus tanneri]
MDGLRDHVYYLVTIIGAGISGIAMSCRLKEALGLSNFAIIEKQSQIGVCRPANLYSFSFAPNPLWTTIRPSGKEIRDYLVAVCERYQITDNIRLNTQLLEARWVDNAQEWELVVAKLATDIADLKAENDQKKGSLRGQSSAIVKTYKIRTKVLISATGNMAEPCYAPSDLPSLEEFEGDLIHTAHWDDQVDLRDKNVAVIGTGCSAAQLIPQLVKPPINVKYVTQVMRSAPWVAPETITGKMKWAWEKFMPWLMRYIPGLSSLIRLTVFLAAEADYLTVFSNCGLLRQNYERSLLKYMRKTVPGQYHTLLSPDYHVGCKRRIFDVEWFKSLQDSRVQLTMRPVRRVEQKSITLGPSPHNVDDREKAKREVKIDVDVIILATGFRRASWLQDVSVKGRDGKLLHELWAEKGGPQAYLGLAVNTFPNLFILFGPNTSNGHTSIIMAIENAVEYCLKLIKCILHGTASSVEVTEEAASRWTEDIQRGLQRTVWQTGGCTSWYTTKDGWNASMYP